jgi:hypothetical protein
MPRKQLMHCEAKVLQGEEVGLKELSLCWQPHTPRHREHADLRLN